MTPTPNRVKVRRHFYGLTIDTNNSAFEVKVILSLESTLNYFTGWVAGKCEAITNSASVEARVEAWVELGNIIISVLLHLSSNFVSYI